MAQKPTPALLLMNEPSPESQTRKRQWWDFLKPEERGLHKFIKNFVETIFIKLKDCLQDQYIDASIVSTVTRLISIKLVNCPLTLNYNEEDGLNHRLSSTESPLPEHTAEMAAAITVTADQEPHDRLKALKAFDELKTGVKGLVDSGITSIPQIFIHPSDTLSTSSFQYDPDIIPTIDLSAVDGDRRPAIVDQIARASRKRGFFHVLNHGIQSEVMDQTIKAVKGFHELPTEIKSKMYNRDKGHSVSFFSNVDLFHNIEAVCWRDSLQIMVGSNRLEDEEIPEICRNEVVEWHSHLKPLAELLIGLICEGLGLDKERLKEMKFSEAGAIVGHYYPYCPQPDLTLGLKSHTDASMLTILLQDHIGGLQIKHNGNWVDVKPVPGALAVFVGDILQVTTIKLLV
ncbi:hypothetical protein HS088_TW13G00653 [Tripterygium wilfordii]|uniref:Fe2OG dioxygenase domain-containing protein n=1 Tax=Tripterygium wilfordii TaxID=458696 RepID=A0A7J7CUL6_TRIWF|nr:hypothetical protein HS088_TW13G00653 [Tripterygium wilfordii]